jgi:hypothetical protein
MTLAVDIKSNRSKGSLSQVLEVSRLNRGDPLLSPGSNYHEAVLQICTKTRAMREINRTADKKHVLLDVLLVDQKRSFPCWQNRASIGQTSTSTFPLSSSSSISVTNASDPSPTSHISSSSSNPKPLNLGLGVGLLTNLLLISVSPSLDITAMIRESPPFNCEQKHF